jgi:hypothetical protein
MTSTATEKKAALDQVLESTTFLRADQLRKFLRYICEMEIEGRGTELCEFLIGVEAFGRPKDYSTAEDSVVRRRAVDLREKLLEVYTSELAEAKLRIELPKGTYVPRFVPAEPARNGMELAPAFVTPMAQTMPARALPARARISAFWFAAIFFTAGVVVTSAAFLTFLALGNRTSPSSSSLLSAQPAVTSSPTPLPPEPGTSYEAEARTNTFSGVAIPDRCDLCSGGSRVRRIGDNPKHYLVINDVMAPKAGNHDMAIFYVLSGNRSFFISVNDGPGIEVPVTGDSWLRPAKATITVTLQAGKNKIKFYNNMTYAPDLDRVVIR